MDNKQLKEYLANFHSGQDEYHQAVLEVFEDIKPFIDEHSGYRDLNIFERLIEPDRTLRFRVTWEDDSGKIFVNRGWRVQFNNALGAYKGGLRFHQSVNESVLKFLGFEQCFKNALTGLPMGGAKGGSDFNPKGKSDREIHRFCCAFVDELHRYIGPDIDVPAGDINVGEREIGFLFGHYLKIVNRWEGTFTGKAPSFGGSCGRNEATGYGVVYFLNNMLQAVDKELKGKKVIISGSGNVALHAAEKCLSEGAAVLCVSDSGGTLYFKNGMNEEELAKIKSCKFEDHGELKSLEIGDFKKDCKPWGIEGAEIALPCATQNELTEHDAKLLAKQSLLAIAEGANMPLTSKAQQVVMTANIAYAPGKAANAGGVAVSGFERTQNAGYQSWNLDEVEDALQGIMQDIHARCIKHLKRKDGIFNYRRGANIYGFEKLAQALSAYRLK